MLRNVKAYIETYQLLTEGSKVLVALSGGADSVVLLYIMRALGYACEAAHCNFHLRGEESMRDEQFVRSLCAKTETPLHVTDFSTRAYAEAHGISIEMAARELRYNWFEELRQQTGAEAIAVAHHQNDQAETLLLNLKRGTGLRGLGGMRPKNGYVIRPLLGVSRSQIERYARENKLPYVSDSTNADTTIRRNAIRAILHDSTEQEIGHMAATAERMQHYRLLLDALLLGTPIPASCNRTLLYELLTPYGFNATQADDMLTALSDSGRRFDTEQYTATIDHGKLSISSKAEEAEKKDEEQPPMVLRFVRKRKAKEAFPPAEEMYALLDADLLPEQLTLRHWQPGDYFYPITNGRPGKKKLQDFFSDQKLSLAQKDSVWVLACGETIVWVVGFRIDNRFKITEKTQNVAELQIE